MRIAVAGGTGTVGAKVVDIATERGADVVVLARSTGVDLRRGTGLASALDGVDAVVDTTSIQTTRTAPSLEFFTAVTQNLLQAEASAGVGHHIALSIIGIDKAPEGYYAGKIAQEANVEAADVPWSILRASQFHEFAPQIYHRAKVGPLHLAPRMRVQPIAASEVAERLVEIAVAGPSGRVADLAGPREENLVDMIRSWARATGRGGWIPAISLPGLSGRAQRDGSLLPGPGAQLGRQTFAEWLNAT